MMRQAGQVGLSSLVVDMSSGCHTRSVTGGEGQGEGAEASQDEARFVVQGGGGEAGVGHGPAEAGEGGPGFGPGEGGADAVVDAAAEGDVVADAGAPGAEPVAVGPLGRGA